MKTLHLLSAATFLFATATGASAIDLPVSYTVGEQNLKALGAASPVTFEVYTDSACAGPMAHTETFELQHVDIISRLKLLKPKGSSISLPKTDELHKTLTGVPESPVYYLKVTSGTNNIAVGNVCQLQHLSDVSGLLASVVTLQEQPTVTSDGSTGEHLARLRVDSTCLSDPCTISSQSGSWVTAVNRTGTGLYTIHFAGGAFSQPPVCTCQPYDASANTQINACGGKLPTTTEWEFSTMQTSAAVPADRPFGIICMGEQ